MTDNVTTYKKSLYQKQRDELKSSIVFSSVAALIMIVLVSFILLTNFIFIKVKVSGSSMLPTLQSGDVVMVNVYGTPKYGDVIVISGEKENGDWLIKRVIALGGDTVKIEGGYVYLKKAGETEFNKLSEPYLGTQGTTIWDDERASGYLIEEGQIFYLGDNRMHSSDSRFGYGTCGVSQVIGTVSDTAIKLRKINTYLERISNKINDLF